MKKLLHRFVDVWKLDFLAKFFAGEKDNNKTTILFWITSNILITVALSISFFFFLYNSSGELTKTIDENIPENARITITDGQLTTENIDEPFFREVSAHNGESDYDENYVVIIDTHSNTYDITSLDEYSGGIIVVGDRAYVKDGAEFNHILFSNVPNFSVEKSNIISFVEQYFLFPFSVVLVLVAGLFMFVWFAGFRLISAFWWALMLFVLIKIFDVKYGYMTSYKAVLNFYFIPTVAVFIIRLVGVHVPLLTTLIFIAVFIANLIWIKKHPQIADTASVIKSTSEIEVKAIKQTDKK